MKRFLFLFLPALLCADDLKSLLEFANTNNNLIVSKNITKQSKTKELESSENSYYPTLDVGANYQRLDDRSPFIPGTTYAGYAKIGFDIYDGSKKSYTVQQKKDELYASGYELDDTKKNIAFAIVEDFYSIKSMYASLQAQEEATKAVKAQLERMQRFFEVKLATSDDVDRLQSAYDKNIYAIESLKLQILSRKKALELKVGKNIASFDDSKFKKVQTKKNDELDAIKALRATKSSVLNAAESVDSNLYPQIRLEDTYSLYGYDGYDATHFKGPDNQNKLLLTLNLRLFDFGTIKEAKEAVKLQASALQEQITYKTKEQKMQQELALERIKTSKLNIESSRSALKAANSALKTITQKYDAGVVDNVVYLDALSSQTEAKAMYESSLNDLEIAYAIYYFYNSEDLEEYLE